MLRLCCLNAHALAGLRSCGTATNGALLALSRGGALTFNARHTLACLGAGALIALAVGIAMGLDYGDNAKAALITRGNAELARLGVAMGCKAETFAGLSGMGDLIVTCTSMHSRNLHAGMLIGRGKDVETAKKEVGQVVEGINALPAACKLAKKYKVEMPIVNAVDDILSGRLAARDALATMMGRQLKQE